MYAATLIQCARSQMHFWALYLCYWRFECLATMAYHTGYLFAMFNGNYLNEVHAPTYLLPLSLARLLAHSTHGDTVAELTEQSHREE